MLSTILTIGMVGEIGQNAITLESLKGIGHLHWVKVHGMEIASTLLVGGILFGTRNAVVYHIAGKVDKTVNTGVACQQYQYDLEDGLPTDARLNMSQLQMS